MADLATLRETVQTALQDIDGLRRYDVALEDHQLPCAIVFFRPGLVAEHETDQSGGERWDLNVILHVSLAQGMRKAQAQLDGYISTTGSKSVNAAIDQAFTDGDFTGVADVVKVHPCTLYGFAAVNGVETLRADVPLTLWT